VSEGKFVRATTRGNGIVGEDVTSQVLTIKTFPLQIKYQGLCEVQGEAVIKLSVLEEYNKTATEVLKNARNDAEFFFPNTKPICVNMKLNTLQSLLEVLRNFDNKVEDLNNDIKVAAKQTLTNMLDLASK